MCPSEDVDQPLYRHMHACEVGLLNGIPPDQSWSDDARLNLCAVGQMASPLQSVWGFTAIMRHLQLLGGEDPIDMSTPIAQLKQLVIAQSKVLYPDIPGVVPSQSDMVIDGHVTCMGPEGVQVVIKVSPGTTVQQLLSAEQHLQGQASVTHAWDCKESCWLPLEAKVQSDTSNYAWRLPPLHRVNLKSQQPTQMPVIRINSWSKS